jgi:exodeoxyribonuclease V alpha subunit
MTEETPLNPRGAVRSTRRGTELWYADALGDERAEELGTPVVHHAAELVGLVRGLDAEQRRVVLDAVLDSVVAQQQGSTRIPAPPAFARIVQSGALDAIVGRTETSYRPLLLTNGWLYHQRTLHYERALAETISERLSDLYGNAPDQASVDGAISQIRAAPTRSRSGEAMELSEEQIDAVRRAAQLSMTVVTGGPGTGKTSIVVSLLRVLVRLGVEPERIALAAPTGKAANRLGESIDGQLRTIDDEADASLEQLAAPSTLHRLLRYSGSKGRFRRDETDPIPADWVIVDEASMIDLILMERLARCVRPDAHLVLLGDVEQLPSVETGTVLRDLIPAGDDERPDEHVVRLRKSFRMDPRDPAGRSILTLAGAVKDGDPEAVRSATSADAPGVEFEDVAEHYRAFLLDFVDEWFRCKITAADAFDRLTRQTYRLEDGQFAAEQLDDVATLFSHFERFRILCLTRVFATGANALNEAFHLRMVRRAPVEGIPDFVAGEPVLMLRNDYDRGLFNGDQGLVLRVDTGDEIRLAAVFGDADGFRAHHLSGLAGQLAHAWAMTVHKSQGSEFDEVTLVLPEEEIPLLSRELLYTALTRARKAVRVIGPSELFALGVGRAIERWSGLAERILVTSPER